MSTMSRFQVSHGDRGNPLSPKFKAKQKLPVLGPAVLKPSDTFVFLGVTFVFSYSTLHLCILGFTFGYIDTISFCRFGLFISGQTGNLVLSALRETDQYAVVSKQVSIITVALLVTTETILGPIISCALLEFTNSREKALAVMILLLTVILLAVDVSTYFLAMTPNNFYPSNFALFLSLPVGALTHWTMKSTYTSAFMTLNFVKTAEFIYRRLRGISQGGPKLRGDVVLTCFIIVAFVTGSFVGAVIHFRLSQSGPLAAAWSFIPLACLSPLHFWAGGCSSSSGAALCEMLQRVCCKHIFGGDEGRLSARVVSTKNPLSTEVAGDAPTPAQEEAPISDSIPAAHQVKPRSSTFAFLLPVVVETETKVQAPAARDEFDEEDVSVVQHANGTIEILRHE